MKYSSLDTIKQKFKMFTHMHILLTNNKIFKSMQSKRCSSTHCLFVCLIPSLPRWKAFHREQQFVEEWYVNKCYLRCFLLSLVNNVAKHLYTDLSNTLKPNSLALLNITKQPLAKHKTHYSRTCITNVLYVRHNICMLWWLCS